MTLLRSQLSEGGGEERRGGRRKKGEKSTPARRDFPRRESDTAKELQWVRLEHEAQKSEMRQEGSTG